MSIKVGVLVAVIAIVAVVFFLAGSSLTSCMADMFDSSSVHIVE